MGRKKLDENQKSTFKVSACLTESEYDKWRTLVAKLTKESPRHNDAAAIRRLIAMELPSE